MGAIRGILFVFVCVLMFLSLFVGGILWTVSSSLQYEHVQPGLSSLIGGVVDEQIGSFGEIDIEDELNELMPTIETYCQDNQEYVFIYGGETIIIPCDILTQGSEAVVSYGVSSLIEEYYYQEYNCDFWDCFNEEEIPLFLISEKAQEYWQSKFYLALIVFCVLAVLAFLLVEKKANFFIITGSLGVIASLPLVKMGSLISRLFSAMGDVGEYASDFILVFFNQANNIFVRIIIFGGVLLIFGIVLKVFHIGFAISKFFGKFSKFKGKSFKGKEISKKEMKKPVAKSSKKPVKKSK